MIYQQFIELIFSKIGGFTSRKDTADFQHLSNQMDSSDKVSKENFDFWTVEPSSWYRNNDENLSSSKFHSIRYNFICHREYRLSIERNYISR